MSEAPKESLKSAGDEKVKTGVEGVIIGEPNAEREKGLANFSSFLIMRLIPLIRDRWRSLLH